MKNSHIHNIWGQGYDSNSVASTNYDLQLSDPSVINLYGSYFTYVDLSGNLFEDMYLKGQADTPYYSNNPYFIDPDSGSWQLFYNHYTDWEYSDILANKHIAIEKVKFTQVTMKNLGSYKCANYLFFFAAHDIDFTDL